MSDFQFQVGGDFSELLRGFQQLEARAQQAGGNVGKGIADGIQGFSSKSIAALQSELARLQQRQTKVAVDSTAFDKAAERIRELQALIAQAERRRLTLNADPRSIVALRAQLSDLQDDLSRVAIGSQRFRELTAAIQVAERELAKVGQSTDQFRLLDGVVQGIAFSLANAVTNGAQQAIAALGNVVSEFGRLDTELRKAAAAGGEAGGYDKLARAVDQVGIEAAGTQLEVAQLATELVRGGMTVDQANQSLAAIVRGAEATGTSFASMGSVVSAAIKGFGLSAADAQRVVDALVQGANASASSVEGMGMAFKYAAPVAKILGVSVEDLGIAVGLLTNAGIDASEAGVTLRNGLSKLASAAPKAGGGMQELTGQSAMAAKAMRALNVDIYNADGTLKPMQQTLLQLKGAFEKLEPASKIRLAANLFGGEDDGAKWLALLNQSEEEIKTMAATMANTKGATDTARDAMQGFELKLKQLDGTLGSIANTFGAVAAAALIPFIDAANVVVGAISALPGPVKTLAAGLTLLAGAYVTARVAATAFGKAMGTEMVQEAIAGVRALATQLRGQFLRDIGRARAAWAALRAGFTTTSTNAAVAGLAQMAQGLRNLNAAQAVAGFKQLAFAVKAVGLEAKTSLGIALADAAAQMKFSAASASVALFDMGLNLRGAARNSAAAEAGLTGVSLLLQRGMTKGADGAAKSALGLSKAMDGLSKVTAQSLATGLKGFASGIGAAVTAAGPLVVALAAIAPAVVGYNVAMAESRQVTATAGKTVEDFGKRLRESGVAFEDFGRQGGPLQEVFNGLQRQVAGFVEELKKIPGLGNVLDTFNGGISSLQGIWEWGKRAVDTVRALYDEASKNQGIIEAVDQFEQYQEQIGKAAEKADAFTAKLKGLGSIPAGSADALTEAFNRNRQALSDSIGAAENLRANYLSLAAAAKGKAAATELEKELQREQVANYENLARAVGADVQVTQQKLAQLEEEGIRRGLVVDQLKQQALTTATLAQQIRALNAAAADTGSALQIGQSLQQYAQGLAELEQSRFAITRARGEYELQTAQEVLSKQLEAARARGASEGEIQRIQLDGERGLEAIRQQNRATEARALEARYAALQQELQIQQALLQLSQQKARAEANAGVANARLEVLAAEKALAEELNKIFKDQSGIDAAKARVQIAKDALTAQQQNLTNLQAIQPLEQLIAGAKGETARNSLIAEAASQGFQLNTSNTVAPLQELQTAAANAGLEFRRAADGSLVLVNAASQAAGAVGQAANQATTLGNASQTAATGAQQTATAAGTIADGMQGAADAAGGISGELGDAANAAGDAAAAAGDVGNKAASSTGKFSGLTKAVVDTAKAAEYGAQMAGQLTRASGSVGAIATAMARAATSAREFYNQLARASGLPGSRWTGGPVAAGQTYRINDGPGARSLGQESFLTAAGQLSLINRPANSLWTAPTSGVVIPAGVTDTLKARGAFDSSRAARAAIAAKPAPRTGGSDGQLAATIARQAVAIGKLQQSVDRLTEKNWNVKLQVRNDSSGPDYLNTLNRML